MILLFFVTCSRTYWCRLQSFSSGLSLQERLAKQASKRRDRSTEENLALFKEMQAGSETGLRNCLRFKIDPANDNGTLRDPVAFRCNLTPHLHTGTKFKVTKKKPKFFPPCRLKGYCLRPYPFAIPFFPFSLVYLCKTRTKKSYSIRVGFPPAA